MIKKLMPILLAVGLSACSTIHSDLHSIHSETLARYVPDAAATGDNVKKPFLVLQKGALASCSHYTALNIEKIRQKHPNLNPTVLIYDHSTINSVMQKHAVVLMMVKDGYVILDNATANPKYIKTISIYKNPKIMTLEKAREIYAVNEGN